MKKLSLIIVIFLLISSNVFSQIVGMPIKGYYQANDKDSFNKYISPEFKNYLNNFYKTEHIDSSNCDFLPSSHIGTTFLVKNLDTVSYKFITITKKNGSVSKKIYDNPYPLGKVSRKKIMVFYGKNEKEKYEVLTIDYIY